MTADSAPPRDAMRVLVVDDHALFRGGLVMLLREHGIEVVGEAPTGEEGVRLAGLRGPDVIIMDLGLPGISGVEAIRRIRDGRPDAAILVITASLDEGDLIEALMAGATGYLLKDAPIEQIVDGLGAAMNGDAVISPRVNRKLVERVRRQQREGGDAAPVDLTDRERQVLALMVEGHDNAEIAGELYLSPSTVKNHVSTILAKLKVENRIQAAVRAVRDDLV